MRPSMTCDILTRAQPPLQCVRTSFLAFHTLSRQETHFLLLKLLFTRLPKPPKIHCAWSQCMPGRFSTTHTQEIWWSIQDVFYHSKMSSRFPKFDNSNVWSMGHNSQEDCFLRKELLLDFAAWIDLTSNANTLIVSVCLNMRKHILVL